MSGAGPGFRFMSLPGPVRAELNRLQTLALQAQARAGEAEKARSREEANRRRAQGKVNHLLAQERKSQKRIQFLESAFHQANERGARAQERADALELELTKLRAEKEKNA